MKTRHVLLTEIWALEAALRVVKKEQIRAYKFGDEESAKQIEDVILYYEGKLKVAIPKLEIGEEKDDV